MQFVRQMKKTIVYIDGFNLYYGLLQGNPSCKWLDLYKFASALLRPDHEIVAIRYFTARIRPYPNDVAAVERQKIYLQALSATGKVQVVEGFYNKSKVWLPAADSAMRSSSFAREGMVRVVKFEEKRSDVNLAVAMMLDAFRNEADSFVVVTGDSDQVGAIESVRHDFGKSVLVFNPHVTISNRLKQAASYYKNIPRDLPARCQLPDTIPCGPRGDRFIHRPPAWR